MTNTCLNCSQPIEGNYCSNCGQKTSTHRFSLKHFFVHDFVHGILHFDKGFVYTIKELFTRPGHSIREFIQGKRGKHFNYFATVILILALDHFISKWFHIDVTKLLFGTSGLVKITKDYSKIVVFLAIPFYALVSYLLFKKSRQNYTEHLILNIYMVCGWLCIAFLNKIIMIFIQNPETFHSINYIVLVLIHIYVAVFYYQYFSVFNYSKLSLVIRVILTTLIILTIKQEINNGLNEIGLRYFH